MPSHMANTPGMIWFDIRKLKTLNVICGVCLLGLTSCDGDYRFLGMFHAVEFATVMEI